MKKLLFTFFGLILCTALGWGAEITRTKHVKDLIAMHGWIDTGTKTPFNVYPSFTLDEVISVIATHQEGVSTSNGTLSSERWFTYKADNNGEFTISAAHGYVINSIAIAYTGTSIVEKGTSNVINTNGTTYYPVNKKSISLCATGNMMKITQFSVKYEPSLDYVVSNVTIGLSNVGYIHPILNYGNEAVEYKSSNTSVADINSSTGAITPKTTGTVTITAKGSKTTATYSLTISKSVYVETFKNMPVKDDWHVEKAVFVGDGGIQEWTVKNGRRIAEDTIMGYKGIELKYTSASYIYEPNLEGGIKHLSFYWRATSETLPVDFRVDESKTTPAVLYQVQKDAGKANLAPQLFSMNVDFPSNSAIRFKMLTENTSNVVVGPWTITPYLLFTNKAVDATNGFYKFSDADLINNTGTTLAKANFEVSDTEAASIDDDGTIRSKQDNKKITLTAKWGSVSTTTELTTHLVEPAGSFADGTLVTKQVGDGAFTNAFNKTVGGNFTYSSTDENVATVNENNGEVTIKNGGMTKIKAVFATSAPYTQKEFYYVLDVRKVPEANTFWAENFSDAGEVTDATNKTIKGADGVDNRWVLTNFTRSDKDLLTIQETQVQGVRIRYISSIASNDEVGLIDGGVKSIAFDWRVLTAAGHPARFTVQVGDQKHDFDHDELPDATTVLPYYHEFNVLAPAKISISNGADAGQAHVIVSPITVVPYLYYATKNAEAKEEDNPYRHPIIDNTDDHQIKYELLDNDGEASIDPETGDVMVLKEGEVTVKAIWKTNETVYTTYTLVTHTKTIPQIEFAAYNLTKDLYDAKFTNTFTTPAGVGDTTYTSSNEEVAKVDAKTGEVTIISAGATTITASVKENAKFAAKSISYNLKVGYTPTEDYWKETFSKCTSVGGTGAEVSAEVDGDDGTEKKWQLIKFRRRDPNEKVGAEQGIQVRYSGSIANKVDLEGGIKNMYFNWKPTNTSDVNHFIVNVNGTDYACTNPTISDKDSILLYARKFDAATNVSSLSIKMDAQHDPQQAFPVIGALKVTPYLLYTRKDTTIKAIDYVGKGVFVNNDFINNTGVVLTAEQEDIEFTISGDENVATINKKGELTILNGGEITVQAKWENIITSYNLKITKEATTVTLEGAEINAFGTYTPNPVAKIGGTTIDTAKFTYSSSDANVVAVVNNQLVFKRVGTTQIKATLVEGATYQFSESAPATLTINEPTGNDCWKETFSKFEEVKDYNSSSTKTTITGDSGVIEWQVKHYRHNFTTDKVNNEQGILLKKAGELKANQVYLAYNGTGEETGGVKAYFFNGRVLNDGPRTAHVNVKIGTIDNTHTFNDVPTGEYFSCAKTIECKTDGMLRIGFVNNDSIVVGPVTIVPYLLYTKRDTTIEVMAYKDKQTFANDKVINNTDLALDNEAITYSIKSATPEGIAEILDANKHNGQVTIHGVGTVVVKAEWEGVSTTYNLNIIRSEAQVSFARTSIDTTMNAEAFTNKLNTPASGIGGITYTSDNLRVAKVDKTSGVVTALGPGEATITANVAKGDLYDATSAEFTINVTTVFADSIEETFPDYQDSPWLSNATTKLDTIHGQLGDWGVLYARHRTTDQLPSKERAVWMNTDGYIKTNWAEGGIKRVSFQYEKLLDAANKRFAVIAGNIADTIKAEEGKKEYTYNHNFFLKRNDTLKIHNISEDKAWPLLVGTIKITPYLYYSIKADTIRLADYQKTLYTPGFLIDNTNGETITYSSSNPAVATVTDGGSVKPLKAADEPVVITAKWKVSDNDSVTTSFSLKINNKQARVAQFTYPTRTIERGETPDNALIIQPVIGDTDPEVVYVSSDSTVAMIGENNAVLTVGPGTAIITAQISETEKCLAGEASYTLTVTYTPKAGTFWNETFSDAGDVDSYTTKTIKGDDGTADKWKLTEFMRHPGDVVGTERGIRLRYEGSIASNIALEGGLKEVVFNWHPYSSTYAPHFYVQVGDSIHSISRPKAMDASKVIPYAHSFGENGKSNTSLKIGNYAKESPDEQGYVVIGEVNVIPYLLYTRKDTTITAFDYATNVSVFENKELINHTDKGDVTYSILDADNKKNIAVIEDASSGVVTIKSGGDVTVQAKWGDVTTTYKLHIQKATPIVTLSDKTIDIFGTYVPVPEAKVGETKIDTAKFTYSSTETKVAVVDDNNAIVLKRTGETTITATLIEGTIYNSASSSPATLKVTEPDPAISWKETFSNLAAKNDYTDTKATLQGDKGVYSWQIKNYRHHETYDLVNGEKGISLSIVSGTTDNTYLAFNGNTEWGGVKAFFFNWRPVSKLATKEAQFTVRINPASGTKPLDKTYTFTNVSKDEYYSCFEVVNSDKDGMLRIGVPDMNDSVAFGPVTIIPYLLYTKRDTTIYAKDYASPWIFKHALGINNIENGTIAYSLENEDKVANIATIDHGTGDVTIQGGGKVKVLATWNNISTSYNLTIKMEEATVSFDEESHAVHASDETYTKTATKTGDTPSEIVYGFFGAHKATTTIDTENGKVSFSAPDTVVVMATIAKSLPYPEDTAKYTLYISALEVPEISVKDTTVTMNAPAFVNPIVAPAGIGTKHYSTSDPKVATVEETTGLVTIIGEGKATITLNVDASASYSAAEVSYLLTVNDPGDGALVETFKDVELKNNTTNTLEGDFANWDVLDVRRLYSGTDIQDTLRSGAHAFRLKNGTTSHLATTAVLEGGIKRVGFYWNNESPWNPSNQNFIIAAGDAKQNKDTVIKAVTPAVGRLAQEDFVYNHNFNVKQNVVLSVYNNSECYALIGNIKITPYLYYKTTKEATIDLKTSTKTCQLVPDIDNRDDKDVSTIKYTFVEDDVTCATIDENSGLVTGLAGGIVHVKAYWSTNEGVYTTYTLTILPDKTTINLMRNDETENYDILVNPIGEVMPEFELPTREGYRFNAYFKTSDGQTRFTRTTVEGSTGWLDNIKGYTGENRIWIYSGNDAVTLYAQWKQERTITLDNQGATTAGTDKVVTAVCPNNNTVNLLQNITVPMKPGYTFSGYYTAENGGGTQLIDANGAFIANVEGYIDSEENFKKWKYEDDIILYAYWDDTEMTIDENVDNSAAITARVGATMKVNLKRTLAAGKFNTFCLPFDITKEKLAEALDCTIDSLVTLDDTQPSSIDGEKKNINIVIKSVTEMKAGKPYLIWLSKAVVNPSFEDVTIKATKDSTYTNGSVTFCAIINPYKFPANDKKFLFMQNNGLYWNTNPNATMKGMRAFFHVPGMVDDPSGVSVRLVISQPTTPTEIETPSLSGEGMGEALKMIIDNQLIILRNGAYYNANGQMLKMEK